ncbi:IS110 family transposase [Vibrio mimicus]
MAVTVLGIDLAKNVFALHGVDHKGHNVLCKPKVSRAKLLETVANMPPCLIGMEACSSAHFWARAFEKVGHEVRLIAPKFVSPYRLSGRTGKNDAADAQAICEAVQRPHMRFVSIKSEEQQSIQCLHRARQGLNEERTSVCNRIRGLLSEFGVIAPLSPERLRNEFEAMKIHLPALATTCIDELFLHVDNIERKLLKFDRLIKTTAEQDERCQQLMKLKGVGAMSASALVCAIADGKEFNNGRQLAAWLGLTPSQYSSGGKQKLGRITKAGDNYIRSLLVQGARSIMASAGRKDDPLSKWVCDVKDRRGYWRAAIALAAKNARHCWAILHYGESFESCYST